MEMFQISTILGNPNTWFKFYRLWEYLKKKFLENFENG